ncbi:hypothetical protein KAI68_04845 [bacterium]|nr:hypothetical protein [bacterium]
MKEYLKERKENKQLVLSQVSGGKTKKNKEKKDVIGEDILGIPRYSGMIRTWYTDDGQSKMIIYEVKATKEELLKFYKKEMVSRGWKQDDKLTQGKKLLTYLKGKKEIQIIVNSNVFSKDKIATVTFLSRNIEKKQQ